MTNVPAGEAGRAWLPASTGLPSDRPPTREEAREAWTRQARGVYEMTRRGRGGDAVVSRASSIVGALLLLGGAAFLAGIVMLPPAQHGGLVVALQVIAGLTLVAAQLAGPSVIASDAMAEATAKSAQAWASSPLPTGAWIAGKSAYYLEAQAFATLRVLPLAAASAALGGIRISETIVVGALGLAWTFVTGVGVAASTLEPRQPLARMAARRPFGGALGGPAALRANANPAAALAVLQIVLGIVGAMMGLPIIFGAGSLQSVPPVISLVIAALCVGSPLGAGASAFFPTLSVAIAGADVPLWCVSLAVAAVVAPAMVAVSRLRWRAPDGDLGLRVRPALLLAWATIAALVFSILSRTPGSAAVAACVVPLIATALAGLTAGATSLPDLAAEAPRRWQRVVGLNRASAHLFALAVLAATTLLSILVAPPALFARLPAPAGILVLAACVAPTAFIAAAMGREGRRALNLIAAGQKPPALRPATAIFGIMLFATFAPVLSGIATSLGYAALGAAMEPLALVSPLHLLLAVGRWLGLQLGPVPSLSAWQLGVAVALQPLLAGVAHVLERRAPPPDVAPLPPPENG